MKKMSLITILWVIFTTGFPINSHAKKADCKKYKTKMERYQALQRTGNTVKRSNKLKAQELKQFKYWRRCKQGKKIKGN